MGHGAGHAINSEIALESFEAAKLSVRWLRLTVSEICMQPGQASVLRLKYLIKRLAAAHTLVHQDSSKCTLS